MTDDTNHSGKTAASTGASVASDIKAAVSRTYDQTLTEARTRADDAKADVATEVMDVATALRHAVEELRDGSAQERTLGQIAGGIADAADAIRDKDLGEMVEMASNLGRRNPALFLGGAALLGFVASRYAKASAQDGTAGAQKATEQKKQVNTFVSEGNPNTQSLETAP
ncbi:hypothetical protein [Roseicyclus mahoneyensis]|uniref:ElaB/YqjD/DUF883 family membrane-anchored ribosome-binding protein n=1 Tax=Roseicyclus mahoneyensis TaxID=164332 RepID=A0A316GNB9_9RHOB|nr:hypothetical protein [Roseicyclus mahoneyensis]PWK61460.1 hypothetical protein C7455_102149 [Roseicyclus mahoneyensis]